MSKHWRAAVIVSACIAGLGLFPASAQEPREFSFGVIGDLAYSPAEEPLLANVLEELNRTPLAFVVHVGDLGSPRNGA